MVKILSLTFSVGILLIPIVAQCDHTRDVQEEVLCSSKAVRVVDGGDAKTQCSYSVDKIDPVIEITSAVQDLPTEGADIYFCECKVKLEDCEYVPTYTKLCPDGSAPISRTAASSPANGIGIVGCAESKAACENYRLEIPGELKIERLNRYGPYDLAAIKGTEAVKEILGDFDMSDEDIKKFDCDRHCKSFVADHSQLLRGYCVANAPRPAPPESREVPLICEVSR